LDLILILKSVVMGLVEGITEFLPISSTGHLILAGDLLDFLDKPKRAVYEIFIQIGAMAAVAWEYRAKLIDAGVNAMRGRALKSNLLVILFVAFLPAAILGLIASDAIKSVLFAPVPVAVAFIVGGFVILWAERRPQHADVTDVKDVTLRHALLIGLCQCAALIPGVSRSGASIIGGMFTGLSRRAATEFSFFLGLPTLGAASLYSLYKARDDLSANDTVVFAVGLIVSFVSALVVIRALLRFVSSHSFAVFAWYRIAFGLIVLVTYWTGLVNWSEP